MRAKQPEAAFQHRCGSRVSATGKRGSHDPALCRQSGVQKLRPRAVGPAFHDARRFAAGNTKSVTRLHRGQSEQPGRDASRAHGANDRGLVKAVRIELPRRNQADPARQLIAARDSSDELLPVAVHHIGDCQRGGYNRHADVDDRLDMRVVIFERMRHRAIRNRRHGGRGALAVPQHAAFLAAPQLKHGSMHGAPGFPFCARNHRAACSLKLALVFTTILSG